MANDVYNFSAGAFDFLDRLIELLEVVDGGCITRPRAVWVGECVILYVPTADAVGAGQ